MVKRENRLKRDGDLRKLFGGRRKKTGTLFSLSFVKNNKTTPRFVFIVSVRVSKNSSARNRLRRQLREIVRLNIKLWKPGYDIAVEARTSALGKPYIELERALFAVAQSAGLLSAK
jgi:ribonuclease P protein component